MPITQNERRVITFYAFKGGVGRSMALANIAYRLAEWNGLHVVAIDWDLEAPGLHTFFDLPPAQLEQAKGLLDYCEDWEEAYRQKAPAPPAPLSYLIPIEQGPAKPTHGSLRLLVAGKLDRHYDARLGRFDWKRFYADSAGAGAVEHLRSELVANADVILIDSRTGLTDPGGICTVQLPDGVVLMTAPNKQSIEGIERVARSIATADAAQRAGRKQARTFLCMSRVPFVEETERTRRWFKEHEAWFDAGVADGLWRRDEHKQGLETYMIPQRAYYGFDECLIGLAKGELKREPLAQAYDELTITLLQWLVFNEVQFAAISQGRLETLWEDTEYLLRSIIMMSARSGNRDDEAKHILELLTRARERNRTLPDEPTLRKRLTELDSTQKPASPSPTAPAPKRTRRK